ncbi:hypothetical protein Pcinc_010144 [Petrolisthes cinctipes]|uniref:Uncharacterized protein n=1 Tax=Petrolisthes cinctipes TaxID=88211 RepID=A0AAE1G3C9_PETCI|nr:hypothetical protein Pcinc_010144 [Petrolisthes cinctipes]
MDAGDIVDNALQSQLGQSTSNTTSSGALSIHQYSFSMFDTVKLEEIDVKSLYEAFKKLCPGKNVEDGIGVQCLDAMPGQRVIKCHFPLDLMPPDLLNKTKVSLTTTLLSKSVYLANMCSTVA